MIEGLALGRTIDTIKMSQRGNLKVASYFEGGVGSNVYVRDKLVEEYTAEEWAALLAEFGIESPHPAVNGKGVLG
jgi:hypothetical protein